MSVSKSSSITFLEEASIKWSDTVSIRGQQHTNTTKRRYGGVSLSRFPDLWVPDTADLERCMSFIITTLLVTNALFSWLRFILI
jgi:hypothetical protein